MRLVIKNRNGVLLKEFDTDVNDSTELEEFFLDYSKTEIISMKLTFVNVTVNSTTRVLLEGDIEHIKTQELIFDTE